MFIRLATLAAIATLALGVNAVASAATGRADISVGPLAGLRDLGPASNATPVRIALVLKYRHDAELDRLLDAQADPSSPMYHRFMTPAQFRGYFAPTESDYARALAALTAGGFTIERTYPNRTVIDAHAPAPVAARFFATSIHRVQQPKVGTQYANVTPGTIPAALRDITLGVSGLSSVRVAHPDYKLLPQGAPHPIRPQLHNAGGPLFGPDGGYGPGVFTVAYDLPVGHGFDGTGQASGIAIDADFLDSDLSAYLSFFGVTRTGPATVRVPIDGGPPPGLGSPDSVETTLDVETIVSLAPGTALYVYEFPNFNNTSFIVDAYNQAVSDNKVDSVNSSFGLCETAFGQFPQQAEAVEKQGNAEGITFHASTGDSGTFTFGCSSQQSVDAPAILKHSIAVGGTTMQVDHTTGQETSEVVWNDFTGATGGGVSVVFKNVPPYQRKAGNIISTGRNDPDLAFDASPLTGESFYYNGRFQGPIGGTSLSSPIFGASITEVDQMRGKRYGYLNPKLYHTWESHGYANGSTLYFRDITSGNNGFYQAQTGYDQVSGIGAMDVTNFGGLLP